MEPDAPSPGLPSKPAKTGDEADVLAGSAVTPSHADLDRLDEPELARDLRRLAAGEAGAFDAVVRKVYPHLEAIARSQMRRHRRSPTLETGVLISETYLKMQRQRPVRWRNWRHFFAVTSQAMSQVLVDKARRRNAEKRGGGEPRDSIDDYGEEWFVLAENRDDLLALGEALERLGEIDPRMRQLVEMRFFGGLGESEIAATLEISERTVQRLWRRAKAWLREELA